VVSNRGVLPWEEIQHQDWGKVTMPMLDALNIDRVSFDDEGLAGVQRASEMAVRERAIVALTIERGNIDE